MVYKFFDKKIGGYGVKKKSFGVTNHQLARELHKAIRKNLRPQNIISILIENIKRFDFADMQYVSKFSRIVGFCCMLLTHIVNLHW